MNNRVAIVGAGGGYRGVAEIGFLEVIIPFLMKMRVSVEDLFLFGVSVSALNFSALATAKTIEELPEKLKELAKKWKLVQTRGPKAVFNIKLRKVWNSSSLLSSKPLFELLVDFNAREAVDSPITFGCFVRNDDTKEHTLLQNHDPYFREHPWEFLKAPIASASLSPYFPRVRIGQYNYCDGGYIDLGAAIAAGCKIIFVLFPYPKNYSEPIASPFVQKHFPVILNLISDAAAVLREKDRDALLFAYAENWRSILASNAINEAITIIEEQPDAAAAYLFGELADKVLENLKNLRRKNNPDLAGAKRLFRSLIKIVPIYASPPKTLIVSSFEPDDFDIVIQKARNAASRECERLSKLLI